MLIIPVESCCAFGRSEPDVISVGKYGLDQIMHQTVLDGEASPPVSTPVKLENTLISGDPGDTVRDGQVVDGPEGKGPRGEILLPCPCAFFECREEKGDRQ